MYGFSNTNDMMIGGAYPVFGSGLGTFGSASATGPEQAAANSPTEVQQAAMVGATGKPLVWWVTLAIGVVLLMFIARKMGGPEEFKNLRPSVYNIVIIAFAAILGISFLKVVFTKVKVPGLSSLILAS